MTTPDTITIADTIATMTRSTRRPTAAVRFGDADAERCGFLAECHDPTEHQTRAYRALLSAVRGWASDEGLTMVEVYMSQAGAADIMVEAIDVSTDHA